MAGALSAVLEASVSAKAVALNQGLVGLLCAQLGAVQSHLVLEPGDTMKRLSTKKKVGINVSQHLNTIVDIPLNKNTLLNQFIMFYFF